MSQSRMLHIVATGAPLTRRVADAIPLARARGWQPAVVATDAADAADTWLDRDSLTKLDVPILGGHRTPSDTRRFPRPDAVILAPATFNTVNKLATGIADTYALSALCGAMGSHTPMVIVPFVSTRLAGPPGSRPSPSSGTPAPPSSTPVTGPSTPTSHSNPGPAKR